ncbi:MAG: T9SS C-terminal target domain-containing protein [Chlorobi bacterium CHB2]|nr:T9SS C-terminal target domain-containing protein [Chlorobi bacterium CHB2]
MRLHRYAINAVLLAMSILAIFPQLLLSQIPTNFGNWQLPKTPQTPGFESRFEDIYFLNERLGWAVNLSGYLYRTTDGGDSWSASKIEVGSIPPALRSITFLDSLRGIIGTYGSSNPILHTTDGGATWYGVNNFLGTKPQGGICGLWKVNNQVVYGSGVYTGHPTVVKTTDGGFTWEGIDMSSYATGLVDCWFSTPDSGFVVGNINGNIQVGQAIILFTADGGKTWQERHQTTRKGEQGWKIFFRTPMEGYVAVQSLGVEKYYLSTTDGGLTWQEHHYATVSPPTSFGPQGMIFMSAVEGWIGGWGNQVWHTTDGGKQWERIEFPTAINFNRWRRVNDTLAFAAGAVIYRYTHSSTTSIRSLQLAVPPTTLHLHPNPASSILYAHLEGLPNTADDVRILNLAGQVVKIVTAPANGMKVAISVADLPTGSYVAQINQGRLKMQRMFVVVR